MLNVYLISFRHKFHAGNLLSSVPVTVLQLIRLGLLIADYKLKSEYNKRL